MTFAMLSAVESLPPALETARGSLADSPGTVAASL